MAICDHCGCFDDNHIDGDPDFEDLTEEQLEDNPDYEPHLYYYWHGDIQEDYQMPAGYECSCWEGWLGNGYNCKQLVNECLLGTHDCDDNAICSGSANGSSGIGSCSRGRGRGHGCSHGLIHGHGSKEAVTKNRCS